jgi:hypothetical protein
VNKRFAIYWLLLALAGCGGKSGGLNDDNGDGDGGDDTPDEVIALVTEVGEPIEELVSLSIDSDGGQLTSSDGLITVEIPAGAISEATTITIQAIENYAPGGRGNAYRLGPEGLHSDVPMTIRFHYNDEFIAGTLARFGSISYQDEDHVWRVYNSPELDETTQTIAVQTSHFSDWSNVYGIQLSPKVATINVNESIELQLTRCEFEVLTEEGEPVPILSLQGRCDIAPLEALTAEHWSVNGVEGGNGDVGDILPDTDLSSGKAVYTAPEFSPAANPVAISVQTWDIDDPDDVVTLVSNISIVQTLRCVSMRSADELDFDVSFEQFDWTASGGDQYSGATYEGHESGQLIGKMQNIVPNDERINLNYGIWNSQLLPHQGTVSVNDTAQTIYEDYTTTQTVKGSGAPYVDIQGPSYVYLLVNYDTCEYQLVASFTTLGTVTDEVELDNVPVPAGAIYYKGLLTEANIDNAILTQDLSLPAKFDPDFDGNGYYPPGQDTLIRASGDASVHWSISLSN